MTRYWTWIAIGAIGAGALAAACSSSSDEGGAAGSAGSAGAANEDGGAGQAGQAGAAGQAGEAGSAGAAGAENFWDSAYAPDCAPMPANGKHRAGGECMSCHDGEYSFAGTVFSSATSTTGAAHVEIGVLAAGGLLKACSATNGNFWVEGGTINWAGVPIRMRNANGEKANHTTDDATAECNFCHTGDKKLVAP